MDSQTSVGSEQAEAYTFFLNLVESYLEEVYTYVF